ncbi:hypothetical protein CFC21_089650 [Triticum aestivum]|uniref:DUF4220 domain-containing protein n=3 Tax=Triticum TaxID=4564 RepID=A0A9R0YUE7_TRITD|nr:uncharacterized protein LOC123138784 [Triticum aestivum]KAF7086357.1 hypothetical protein CFC21_089650 [Triticum aestivum]VAI61880.1 unnamed protein product [Triticum turgidum subsp. durum]
MADNSTSWSNVQTVCCKDTSVLKQCTFDYCPEGIDDELFEYVTGQLWRVGAMMLVNAILAGLIVGIGAYGHRYRHYGFTRYLLLGATTLFLPIISYVLSATGSTGGLFRVPLSPIVGSCLANFFHTYMVIVSTCLVLISAINTSPIVATDDREDRSIRPPFELLIQGIWIVYLVVNTHVIPVGETTPLNYLRISTPFALIHAKMALKCYAFVKARKSFALGRNPRLVIGYMQQLREGSGQNGEPMPTNEEVVNVPPPLIVMGEDEQQVEKQPHGYMFRNNLEGIHGGSLVTIDRVWKLDNMLLVPIPQLKDTCLSFALFKLLRCRFARYKLTGVISIETLKFCRSVLLKDGGHERSFRMVANELSFLHDYYDSPLPVSYSGSRLTIFSMVISLLTISYCLFSGMDVIPVMYNNAAPTRKPLVVKPEVLPHGSAFWSRYRMHTVWCVYACRHGTLNSPNRSQYFGSLYFDLVPLLLLLVFVVVAEARDIASHMCSSWTKVILTCRCVHRVSLKLSPIVPKWVGFLLRCRCNMLQRHWNDNMRQTSLLVLHRRQLHQLLLPGCLLHLLGRKRRNNGMVPSEVKACIINALRNGASLSKGTTSLRQSQVGRNLLWACNNNEGTSDTILVWHIATTILEVRHPHHQQDGRPSSVVYEKKIAATHLSCYCAYLVAFCPELLPNDNTWSKHLYKKVKKDAERALTGCGGGGIEVSSLTPEAGYRQLIELLGATQNREVLKDAAKLARQLGGLTGGEEMLWELLAGFWSEMILYLAPSDNLKGHLRAIDRGGELITLLWALLTHIGIIDRPDDAAASAPATGV